MALPTFDLQSHSTCSDGVHSPAEVVARAATAGVELLALTDHDTVDGVEEALAAAGRHGVRLTPATELSSVDAGYEDFHILGYEIDHRDETLRATLTDLRGDRARRIDAMAERLREEGFAVDPEALDERRRADRPLGRPHLADAVLDDPANAALLAERGIAGRDALFAAYLVPGATAYVPRTRPTVEEAIALIHAAGGVAVWAHPFWDLDDAHAGLDTLDRFADVGLDGVECFYPSHTAAHVALLHGACIKRDLLMTGSADFHGREPFTAFRAFDLHGFEPRLGPIGA